MTAVFFRSRHSFSSPVRRAQVCRSPDGFPPSRKKPEVIRKKGTATRAITLVRIKSPVSEKDASGEV